MIYRKLGNSNLNVSCIILGAWSFGSDKMWWGEQPEDKSIEVMEAAIESGINTFDTAPIYGRGKSEIIIGKFLKQNNYREKVYIATKVGLSWEGGRIYHDLTKKRIMEEIDISRKQLQTDYIDLYQVHWPDPDTPIAETASAINELFEKGVIKAVGVSNYSVEQMKEFMKYSPLHSIQPPYNMFNRDIENEIVPFCVENNIGIISYVPLQQGVLTGKYFFSNTLPAGKLRAKSEEYKGERYNINKDTLIRLKEIADKYNASLTQLAINWNFNQKGITAAIVGARNKEQMLENSKSVNFSISDDDMKMIDDILTDRAKKIADLK